MRFTRTLCALSLCVLLAACASGYRPMPEAARGASPRTATLLVTSPPAPIYRQVVGDPRRVARIDLNPLQQGLVRSSLSMVGSALGQYLGVLATAGQAGTIGMASEVVPVLGVVVAGATAAGSAVVDAHRQREAEAQIVRHQRALADFDLDRAFVSAARADAQALDRLDIVDVRAFERGGEDTDGKQALEQMMSTVDTDTLITVTLFPQLSPNFEVLEVHGLVSVYDLKGRTPTKPLYADVIIFQSREHAGLYPGNSLDSVAEALAAERARREAQMRHLNGGRELNRYQRVKVQVACERYARWLNERYLRIDEHDPLGDLWLTDDGAPMRSTLKTAAAEIARVAVADIDGQCTAGTEQTTALPGITRTMARCTRLDAGDREVFRDKHGTLYSVDRTSRFLPEET